MSQKFDPLPLRLSISKRLHAIEQLYADLHWQAVASFADRDFPGGRALNMLGPAANRQDWDAQYFAAEMLVWEDDEATWDQFEDYFDDQISSEEHPLYVLDSWVRIIREEQDKPSDLKSNVSRCVAFLLGQLDWMLRVNEWDEPAWPAAFEVESELRSLVRSMENVLSAGARPEITRVTCTNPECETQPRLHKIYSSKVSWDRYKCPACRMPYDHKQFKLARTENLRKDGTDRFVLVSDAMKASETPKPTMRSWMRRMDVRSACDMQTRRLLVWWPDVRERAQQRKTRKDAS
jgi:hypothetical protein